MVARSKSLTLGIGVLLFATLACGGPPAPTAAPFEAPDSEPTTLATEPPTAVTPDTESPPFASVTADANCRSGPGQVYDVVSDVTVGTHFVIVGKTTLPEANYWIIQLPDGQQCWLWDQSTMVEGNLDDLPEIAAPATPTPPLPVGVILVTIVGPVRTGENAAPISGATVELGISGANDEFMPTGERAEELEKPGHYRFLNVSAGEKRIRVTKPPDYDFVTEAVNVVIGTEPSRVEISMGWVSYALIGCARLPTPLQRFRCYSQLNAHLPGDNGADPGLLLDPSATP